MTIDIDPVIGKLGPLEFRWYGVIMAVAVAFGLWVMSRELKHRGISPEHVLGIAIFGVPCGVIGARLVHIFDHLGYYIDNPDKIFGLKLVGLAIYGVVGGGLVGVLLYCKWKKISVLKVIDSTALAFASGQIIGKCANIINGDTWGGPTTSAWHLTYVNPESFIPDSLLGVPTHPTPMYEQVWLVVVVALLIWLMPRLRRIDGLTILTYAWLYSLGRFFISFFRENEPMLWGLVEAQVIGLVVLVLVPPFAYWLIRRARRRGTLGPVAGSTAVAGSAAAGAVTAVGTGAQSGAAPGGEIKAPGAKGAPARSTTPEKAAARRAAKKAAKRAAAKKAAKDAAKTTKKGTSG
ncbi:MAG: prolipoprotein diacylglyceryl transferase [Thermoleophilia bacterium]|nr:prolipoprotein diacylglyceryl transferase [Thermoleophilia bacterium]